ncbi:MAG TPA: NF038122 family metalloprotease [Xanthobacteraceae bacterium]|nr:NF038122 family metalloprotease [Xanthobacteraceae bacterium]
MNIEVSFDQSISSLPSGFVNAVDYVVSYFDNLFTAPVTLNIAVGYGEIDGQALAANALGESLPGINGQAGYVYIADYTQTRNALLAQNAPGASTLPSSSPAPGSLLMTAAEAQALGLAPADAGIDGWVGFSSVPNTFSYAIGTKPPSTEYYFVGVVEHEITEVMGRTSFLDSAPSYYSVMDLFRYAAPGVRQLGTGAAAYFSIDNGNTNLDNWNNYQTGNTGDLGDWAPSASNDAVDDNSNPGVINQFTASDVTLMKALGWTANVVTQTLPASLSGNENSPIALSGISIASAITGDTLTTTLAVSHGTITIGTPGSAQVTGNGSNSVSVVGTAAAINAALATANYNSNTDYYGGDSLSVTSTDGSGNTSGLNSSAINIADTAIISETAPTSLTGNENTAISLAGVSIADSPNSGDTLTTLLAVSHGTITVGSPGSAQVTGNGSASVKVVGSAAAINAALATTNYAGNANYSGSDSLSVTITDAGGRTSGASVVPITINAPALTVAVGIDNTDVNIVHDTGTVTFAFSQAPTEFVLSDVTCADGTLSNFSGSGTTYTATFTANAGIQDNKATVAVIPGSYHDASLTPGSGGSTPPFTVDTVAPTVTAVTASPTSGDENSGTNITLNLTFSEAVTISGTPALLLNDGATAIYQGGSGTNVLTFVYPVADAQNTPALAVIGSNLNGSSIGIADLDGNEADLSDANVTFQGLEVGATVQSVACNPPSADLGPGKVVTFTVMMSEPVVVAGGPPSLGLNDGGTAAYKSGSGTNVLSFAYTVGALGSGQNTPALAVTGLNLNGATIYDSGVAADIASLSGVTTFATGPQVDTTAPTVASVIANPANADLDAGSLVSLTVTFSENVNVTGTPYLSLNDGGRAYYAGGSGSNALTFTYAVAAGQNTGDLTITGSYLNGGTIRDLAGNNAVLMGAVVNPTGTLQIDTKAPAVTARLASDTGVSSSDHITDNDALAGGGDPNAIVHFTVDGSAVAAIATASSTGAWTFIPTGLADGQHTVVASETDAAGNTGSASLTFTLDTAAPVATSIVASPSSGDLDAGTTVALSVTFDSPVYANGSPYLVLNDGGKAYYVSGAGTNIVTFNYTVASGQNTSALGVVGGAGLRDVGGNVANFTDVVGTLPNGPLQIDTTPPKISSITSSGTGVTSGSGDRGPGSTVTLTVKFSEPVNVNTAGGTPTLGLSDGATAAFVSALGSSLVFAYTVGPTGSGQNSADLALAASNAFQLNGATITDNAGNAANLTGADGYNPAGTLQIDTLAPSVTAVVTSATSGEVTTGQTVVITLDMSEKVSITGSPTVLLNDGGTATYDVAHSTATTLAFDYTVASGQVTTGLAVSGMQLAAQSALSDLAGNPADLTGAGVSLGLQVNTTSTGPAGPTGGSYAINGTQALALFGSSTANVTFAANSTGTLALYDSQAFNGTIAGLNQQNRLDLSDINFATIQTPMFSGDSAQGTLEVSDGTHMAALTLLGNYMASSFVATSDGHGGTIITDPPLQVAQNQLAQPHA